MKVLVNYELLDKIKEAKTGFSLDRTFKVALSKTVFWLTIGAGIDLIVSEPVLKNVLFRIPVYFTLFSITEGIPHLFLRKISKERAISELKQLSSLLKDLYIDTDYELLLNSYEYKTTYRIKFNEAHIPTLKQNKYIMVPTHVNGEIKEVSLLQEHIILSKKYALSHGSPKAKKVLKLATSSI